jgi:alkylation response protein AidB-like acyl-CoA dehydrogenase
MNRSARTTENDEIKAINDLADSFAKKELLNYVHEFEYPYARDITGAIEAAGSAGLFGVNLPADLGGTMLGAPALAGMLERVSAIDAGMAAVLFTHAAALEVISAAVEDDAERCRSVYELVAESVPLAFQSYTSPLEIEIPKVVVMEGKRLLSGRLSLLALGGMARYAVVAGSHRNDGGFSCYLIDLTQDGVTRSGPILTLGLQACRAIDTDFKDVPALLIGAEGKGAIYFHTMQSRMSIAAAAISLGILEGSFKEALEYSKQRYQGGRNIVEWSGVRRKLADMAVQIAVGRHCLSGICSAYDAASPDGDGSAVAAALHISDMACSGTSEGVQLLGGNGYMKDYGQEKRMRDARQAGSLLGMSGLKKMEYIAKVIAEGN